MTAEEYAIFADLAERGEIAPLNPFAAMQRRTTTAQMPVSTALKTGLQYLAPIFHSHEINLEARQTFHDAIEDLDYRWGLLFAPLASAIDELANDGR